MLGRLVGRMVTGLAALASTAGLVVSVAATGGSASFAAGLGPAGERPAMSEEAVRLASPDQSSAPPSDAEIALAAFLSPAAPAARGSEAAGGREATAAPVAWITETGAAQEGAVPASEPVPVFTATVVARYPHDRQAFTQGLIWRDGALYESLGKPDRSEVRRVRLEDGRVLARAPIPADQFGEGLAAHGRELVSLTWQHGIAHRWDARTLKRVGEWRYPGEGWGLAGNGRELALSDGTPTLRFMDPDSFAERRRVTVRLRGRPLRDLNELEWVDGALWGNVWHTPYLVRVDPATGAVTAIADLSAIVREVNAADPEAVANGIAWDARAKRLFVTGKLWPALFEVRLEPRPG